MASVQVSVSLSDLSGEFRLPLGALWALASAFLYACYIVLLRARVDHEDKLDLPMFFGKNRPCGVKLPCSLHKSLIITMKNVTILNVGTVSEVFCKYFFF